VASSIVYGVLVVGGVCLVAVGGLALVQFLVPTASRQRHNDVAGFIYAVLGVIYAVLLRSWRGWQRWASRICSGWRTHGRTG
jgi:hypothetical protein